MLTVQPMEVEIDPTSTVQTQIPKTPDMLAVYNTTMEQTGTTPTTTEPTLQQDVHVEPQSDSEKASSELAITTAGEHILAENIQSNLPDASGVSDVPMEVDHDHIEPSHQVDPIHEDSQRMDMDVDQSQSVVESDHIHNVDDSHYQPPIIQKPGNQSLPIVAIPVDAVTQFASHSQVSEPAHLTRNIDPVVSAAEVQDQVQEQPMPHQAAQKPGATEVFISSSTVLSYTYYYSGAG